MDKLPVSFIFDMPTDDTSPQITDTIASMPRRVVVAGTTGSGKTTTARRIAAIIDAPHTEMDSLFHEPNWKPAEIPVFRERVDAATAGERWVIDGGYVSHIWDIAWTRADTLVWLDYPFRIVVWRLARRSLRRGLRREELWNGNRESLREQFLSGDSLLIWARKTHWKHRREYPARLGDPSLAHLRMVRLRTPQETQRFVDALASSVNRNAAQRAAS
jgi:adenylate kinase family enzyme